MMRKTLKHALAVFMTVAMVVGLLPVLMITAKADGTLLSTGDIVFVGLNTDGDDEFTFLLLKDITAGTSIYITDKGWNDGSGFQTILGDGIWEWIAATDMSAGNLVHIKTTNNGIIEAGSLAASPGTVSWVEQNSTVISYSGDQLFLYQGTEASPTIIAGIHWNVEAGTTDANWDGSASSAQTSALPDQLTNGVNAIWVYESGPTERDNFRYNGAATSGTPTELRVAINNLANWDVDTTGTSGETPYTINPFPVSFTVTPEAAAPTVTLSVDSANIAENGGGATVTATLSAASASNVTVDLGYTGTATGGGTDYTASAASIVITAGDTTGTATITAVNDAIDEDDETVIIDITSVTNGTEDGVQQKTVTITDDDAAPTISIDDPSVAEGNSGTKNLTFTVTLSAASGKTVTVDYATADGTATTADSDYTAANGTLTFTPGQTTKQVAVTVSGDTVTEPDETLSMDLSGAANATISDNLGVGTITNDDAAPAISVNDVSAAEGNVGTQTFNFTVSLDHASTSVITVEYATADNTATSGSDYAAASGTLTFAAGETSKTVGVTVNCDTGYEPDESFYINLSGASNATIGDAQGVGTITNDDAAPTVTLSVDSANIAENGGGATVTATLSAASASNVTVDLGYTGTATGGGTDYTVSAASIVITAGNTTGTATVTAVSDTTDENDETVIIDITGVTNGTENGVQQRTVTITDDDAAPTISIDDPSVAEGNSGTKNLTFTVTLSAASGKTVTVDYATADGTATTADSDYTAASGTVTFTPGQTTKTINVTVTGDTIQEAGETVLMDLSGASNATISDNLGVGTITDDDKPPVYVGGGGTGDTGNAGDSTDTNVEVNGTSYSAGTSVTTTNSGGQSVTTVTVDTQQLQDILENQGQGATVTIPVTTGSDVAAGVMTGDMIGALRDNGATLVIDTGSATYSLPADEINIDAIAGQLGALPEDVTVTVSVSAPSDDMVTVVENAAGDGGFTLVVPAVEFTVSCSYGDETVDVTSFNAYVDRTITIPDGVDPSQITTAVVVGPDGAAHSVPTEIVYDSASGHWVAIIHSLTNSVYAVIWNPVEFPDVADHWARDIINDMGSRMIVSGDLSGNFNPDLDITRAEFAAIIVRALGLEPGTGVSGFDDVKTSDWFCGYVQTAVAYGIINGCGDGTFAPNELLTREQAMTMLARAMTITGLGADVDTGAVLLNFNDGASVSDYAKDGVAACIETGIITGKTSVTIAPKDVVTRAEVAVMVQRLLTQSGLI